MAVLLSGNPVAEHMCRDIRLRWEKLSRRGVTPTLGIVRVGRREEDIAYERGAIRRAESLNIAVRRFLLPADASQQELIQIDTTNILFICGGAFDGLEKIIETRMDQKTIGFNADIRDKRDYNIGDVLKHALPQDFVKFGLIPEFIGRVPVTVSLDMLDRDALIRILQEPKNALTKQYQKLFELDGVALDFDKEALEAIADKALERKTGARGLRAIMEAVTLDLMYHIPSDESITQCQITKEMVDEQLAIEERELEKIEEKQVG